MNNTKSHTGSFKPYIIGFILSLILTFLSYILVTGKMLENSLLIGVLIFLAGVQVVIQLFYFLHIGQESKPRWNLLIFLSTLFIILLIVVGSLWIMDNLNHRMMESEMVEEYIMHEERIYR